MYGLEGDYGGYGGYGGYAVYWTMKIVGLKSVIDFKQTNTK